MEFRFNINEIFKQPIIEIGHSLIPAGFKGDRRQLWDTISKVTDVVNAMGSASATAQGLTKSITTSDRLRNSDQQTLYLLIDQYGNQGRGAVTGMLKTGKKGLYVFDRDGHHYQVQSPCILDFYVHESRQRSGFGKQIFEYMLQREAISPEKLAIDRPSDKFLGFLQKHYKLQNPIRQMNNFVVFDGFFPKTSESDRSPPVNGTSLHGSNGLQSHIISTPYGRYGAPRPPCSMGQIIHNQSSTVSPTEPTGTMLQENTVNINNRQVSPSELCAENADNQQEKTYIGNSYETQAVNQQINQQQSNVCKSTTKVGNGLTDYDESQRLERLQRNNEQSEQTVNQMQPVEYHWPFSFPNQAYPYESKRFHYPMVTSNHMHEVLQPDQYGPNKQKAPAKEVLDANGRPSQTHMHYVMPNNHLCYGQPYHGRNGIPHQNYVPNQFAQRPATAQPTYSVPYNYYQQQQYAQQYQQWLQYMQQQELMRQQQLMQLNPQPNDEQLQKQQRQETRDKVQIAEAGQAAGQQKTPALEPLLPCESERQPSMMAGVEDRSSTRRTGVRREGSPVKRVETSQEDARTNYKNTANDAVPQMSYHQPLVNVQSVPQQYYPQNVSLPEIRYSPSVPVMMSHDPMVASVPMIPNAPIVPVVGNAQPPVVHVPPITQEQLAQLSPQQQLMYHQQLLAQPTYTQHNAPTFDARVYQPIPESTQPPPPPEPMRNVHFTFGTPQLSQSLAQSDKQEVMAHDGKPTEDPRDIRAAGDSVALTTNEKYPIHYPILLKSTLEPLQAALPLRRYCTSKSNAKLKKVDTRRSSITAKSVDSHVINEEKDGKDAAVLTKSVNVLERNLKAALHRASSATPKLQKSSYSYDSDVKNHDSNIKNSANRSILLGEYLEKFQ